MRITQSQITQNLPPHENFHLYITYIALLDMVGVKTKFGMPVNSVTPVATPADGTSVHGIWFGTLCCHDAPRPGTRPNGM